jgi:glycosidase
LVIISNYSSFQTLPNKSVQVIEQLEAVMEFWLKEGVDGFNIDSVNLLVEDFATNKPDQVKNKVQVSLFVIILT